MFGENANSSGSYEREMDVVVRRLASVHLPEGAPRHPVRMGKPPQDGDPAGASERHLISQRIASPCIAAHEHERNGFQRLLPKAETCDLVIVDRGSIPSRPSCTSGPMSACASTILDGVIDNNIFKYTIDTNKGSEEERRSCSGAGPDLG